MAASCSHEDTTVQWRTKYVISWNNCIKSTFLESVQSLEGTLGDSFWHTHSPLRSKSLHKPRHVLFRRHIFGPSFHPYFPVERWHAVVPTGSEEFSSLDPFLWPRLCWRRSDSPCRSPITCLYIHLSSRDLQPGGDICSHTALWRLQVTRDTLWMDGPLLMLKKSQDSFSLFHFFGILGCLGLLSRSPLALFAAVFSIKPLMIRKLHSVNW